jgi:pseudaminic acid biosynthesis-associated methylase
MERHPKKIWSDGFGEQWTDRNQSTVDEIDRASKKKFGVSRTERLKGFLDKIDRDIKILEVGANIGTQLKIFEKLGFERLYGIDVQRKAINEAHQNRPNLDIIEGDALDIPFRDDFFDLVFTHGLLIHIPPGEIEIVMTEIDRCTSEWVYGIEYYAKEYTKVNYRGHDDFLWKTDFPSLYEKHCDLKLSRSELFNHPDSDDVDAEFLLQKTE